MARMNQSVRCVVCAKTMELQCLAEHISHHVGYSPYKCRQCSFATPFYAEALLHCEKGNGHGHQYHSDEKIQVAVQALFSRCLDEEPTGGALLGQLKREFEESVKEEEPVPKEEDPVPKEEEKIALVIPGPAPLVKPQERPEAERTSKAPQKSRSVPAKEAVPNPPNTPRTLPRQSPLRRQSSHREERNGMSPLRSQSRHREEMLHRSVMKKRSASRRPSPTRHSSGKAPRLNLDEGSNGGHTKVETIHQRESSVQPSYYSDWADYSDWTWSRK